ncbi:hypothetical protein [Microbacterium sp. YY-01]|uniref:hypothetical protein n=1 Tax=Microbacterium sp. YY-01 TaxID=3421634 RepID=UPI003D177066
MATPPLPATYKLTPHAEPSIVFSDEYEHWTVSDLIEYLQEYESDARVWVREETLDDGTAIIRPIELIAGTRAEVVL